MSDPIMVDSSSKTISTLTLLGTTGCHLCDDAEAVIHSALSRHAVPYQLRQCDIADSEAALARYGVRIPVLRFGEQELDWPFDGEQVIALLEG